MTSPARSSTGSEQESSIPKVAGSSPAVLTTTPDTKTMAGETYAFPRPFETTAIAASDMTLRDYFAGQAIGGVLAIGARPEVRTNHGGPATEEDFAGQAYALADAMLAERAKGSTVGEKHDKKGAE